MSPTKANIAVSSSWRDRAILLTVGLIGLFLILSPTYLDLFDFWWNYSAYNHCILIIPISLFLAYEKRADLLGVPPDVSWLGYIFFVANACLWFVGSFLFIAFFQHLAAIGLVVGLIWTLIGNTRAWLIAFPLFYLYFGVPFGEALVPQLRDLTADVVVTLLRISGIPVFLEGRYITIPSGQFHVAKACSGINYLIATLAVGSVFAYVRYKSPWRRIFFMTLAVLVPLVANGLRAYGIVMIAHLSQYKYAIGIDHYIYGWLFFGLVIFILFFIGNLFSDEEEQGSRNCKLELQTGARDLKGPVVAFFLCISTIFITGLAQGKISTGAELKNTFMLRPTEFWALTNNLQTKLLPDYSGDPIRLSGHYTNVTDNSSVTLEVAIYLDTEKHGELENLANIIYDEENWQRVSGPSPRTVGNLQLDEYILRRGGADHIVWTWYNVRDRLTADPREVKWQLAKDRLTGNYEGGAQITLATAAIGNEQEARVRLAKFVADYNPAMERFRTDSTR